MLKQQQQPRRSSRKKKKAVKKKTRNSMVMRRPQSMGQSQARISSCAQAYLNVLSDPFNYRSTELPCIPDFPPLPSHKFVSIARGTAVTGSAAGALGVGFVLVSPNRMLMNNATSSSVWDTNNLYIGAAFATSGTGVNANQASSQYAFTATPARQARVVGCGIRVRNISTNLNLAGLCVGVVNPNHTTLVGYTQTDLLGFPDVQPETAADRKWHTFHWSPVTASETQYSVVAADGFQQPSGTYTPDNAPHFGVMINTEMATPQTFYYEVVTFFEMTGNALPNATISHSDPVGFSTALEVVNTAKAERRKVGGFGGALNSFGKILSKTASGLGSVSGPIVEDLGNFALSAAGKAIKSAPDILKIGASVAPLLLM